MVWRSTFSKPFGMALAILFIVAMITVDATNPRRSSMAGSRQSGIGEGSYTASGSSFASYPPTEMGSSMAWQEEATSVSGHVQPQAPSSRTSRRSTHNEGSNVMPRRSSRRSHTGNGSSVLPRRSSLRSHVGSSGTIQRASSLARSNTGTSRRSSTGNSRRRTGTNSSRRHTKRSSIASTTQRPSYSAAPSMTGSASMTGSGYYPSQSSITRTSGAGQPSITSDFAPHQNVGYGPPHSAAGSPQPQRTADGGLIGVLMRKLSQRGQAPAGPPPQLSEFHARWENVKLLEQRAQDQNTGGGGGNGGSGGGSGGGALRRQRTITDRLKEALLMEFIEIEVLPTGLSYISNYAIQNMRNLQPGRPEHIEGRNNKLQYQYNLTEKGLEFTYDVQLTTSVTITVKQLLVLSSDRNTLTMKYTVSPVPLPFYTLTFRRVGPPRPISQQPPSDNGHLVVKWVDQLKGFAPGVFNKFIQSVQNHKQD